MVGQIKYEVTFKVTNPIGACSQYYWTACYLTDSFSHAEELALQTLANNKSDDTIHKIEVW